MSVRALGTTLLKHGIKLFQPVYKRELGTVASIIKSIDGTTVKAALTPVSRIQGPVQPIRRSFVLRHIGTQLGLHARKILIDNVLNRVSSNLASELRKKAARRILFGDSGPFFALIGVSLASGSGVLTKEDELEGVCYEIRSAVSKIQWSPNESTANTAAIEKSPQTVDNLELGEIIGKGTNGVVYSARLKSEHNESTQYPLALKMMFNYDIQSNSLAILRGMYRETVPAYSMKTDPRTNDWEIDFSANRLQLPPHPNIVQIYSVFADYIQHFRDCDELYPAALPRRLHPEGEGRNMSLFLLMKRYNTNLQDYLKTRPSLRTSILLFAQLLESVTHMTDHGIAHRDLKSDNLLLDTTYNVKDTDVPILVVSDFGCCLADKRNGLVLPYNSYDIDKGGNRALMAPEIITKKPGTFSVLNYTKSDLWTAAVLAYEIFGCENPFYTKNGKLRNTNYSENHLPDLPIDIPIILRELIHNLLQRNPKGRLHSEIASNVVQLFLWAPTKWLDPDGSSPSSTDILQWLLSLTTKVLYEGKTVLNETCASSRDKKRTFPEFLLISSFLGRASLHNIRLALNWIREIMYYNDNSME